jgi:hypothetical protein
MGSTVKQFILVLVAGLLMSSAAHAASLGVYEFQGTGTAGDDSQPTNAAAGLTYTGFARTGLAESPVTDVHASTDWDASSTFNTGEYLSFTVTADANRAISMETLTYKVASGTGEVGGESRGPTKVFVSYSTNGFTTAPVSSKEETFNGTLATKTFNFADVTTAPGATVEFRFYAAGSASILGVLRLDDVSLNGTVAEVVPIPEPAALALFGVAGLCVLGRRRHHR